MSSVDGVDGVIYRAVHGVKAAGGVDGCRLRARGADNDEKCSIPLHHLGHGFRRPEARRPDYRGLGPNREGRSNPRLMACTIC